MQKNSNQVSTFKKNYLVSIRKPTGTVIDETKCKDNKRKNQQNKNSGFFQMQTQRVSHKIRQLKAKKTFQRLNYVSLQNQ